MQNNKYYLIAALSVLLVAGFLATTFIGYLAARDSMARQITEEALPLTSDNVYSEIQRDLLTPVLISSLMARDTFVRDWVLEGEQEEGRIRSYLREMVEEYNTITAFFVSERTRRYYHPDGVLKTVAADDPGDAWYFRVRDLRGPFEINLDTDTADPGRLSIFINYRVLGYAGELIGVTGVGLAVDSVAELVESYQRRFGRTLYFIDREGAVTLSGRSYAGAGRIQETPGLGSRATHILTSPSASVNYVRDDGKTVHVNSRLMPEFDWYLVVEQESGTGTQAIRTSLFVNLAVSIGVTALVLLGAYLILSGYQRRMEVLAATDRLTGAGNRQVFDIVFEHIAGSLKRSPRPVAVILFDLDRFKAVNDTYGHPGGDAVLRHVVSVVRRQVRESDTLCRWGGEEFLILLDDCDHARALARAETIRTAIKQEPARYGREQIAITVSAGVAVLQPGEDAASLIARADAHLYAAKRGGRDQVIGSLSGFTHHAGC
jgi:diguanylate cyclase (GGDEF)-like protein